MTKAKMWLAALGAIVTAAIAIVDDGAISAEEAGFMVTTILTTFGVWRVPNHPA